MNIDIEIKIMPDGLYTEEQAMKILGNFGKAKMREFRKAKIVVPYRTRPTLYLGETLLKAKTDIVEYEKERRLNKPKLESYGIY